MAVLELNAEHCIGQRFDYASLDLDGPVFLSHILRDPLVGIVLRYGDAHAVENRRAAQTHETTGTQGAPLI
ncbi:hypothetical protein BTZ20_1560 [Rhodococcus sp. MTM3W5.2]|nr:hypothetical protein BTZ20_1560 [Rhodococcus sp. MTM3W5.2]